MNSLKSTYEKVPPPELNEIEENESDSTSMPFTMTLRSRKKWPSDPYISRVNMYFSVNKPVNIYYSYLYLIQNHLN